MEETIWLVTFICDHALISTRIDSNDNNEDTIEQLAINKLLDMVGIDVNKLRIIDVEIDEVN
jgi:hypothetical protein